MKQLSRSFFSKEVSGSSEGDLRLCVDLPFSFGTKGDQNKAWNHCEVRFNAQSCTINDLRLQIERFRVEICIISHSLCE